MGVIDPLGDLPEGYERNTTSGPITRVPERGTTTASPIISGSMAEAWERRPGVLYLNHLAKKFGRTKVGQLAKDIQTALSKSSLTGIVEEDMAQVYQRNVKSGFIDENYSPTFLAYVPFSGKSRGHYFGSLEVDLEGLVEKYRELEKGPPGQSPAPQS